MVAVVTDSAANLPSAMAGDLGIEVVPMYLNFGDGVYRDGVDLTPRDFYDRLAAGREVASTSMPAPGDYLDAFERTGQREIVVVCVAAAMSSAHHQARLAAEQFEGRVEIVDSKSASMGQGFVAREAARVAADGGAVEAVTARATEVAARARLLACVGTFQFLQRSGRVRKLQAYAATMLDIKPVFEFEQGEVIPIARPRTRQRALHRIVEEAVEQLAGRPAHLAAVHAAAEADAVAVASGIEERADVVERLVVEVTPVVGAHVGPGLVGAAFYWD